jgi:stearoyl-CoA desaturase (delta-9 desaturase)
MGDHVMSPASGYLAADAAASRQSSRNAGVFRRFAWIVVLTPMLGTGAALWLWFVGYGPGLVEWSALGTMYALTITGIEVGFHRYFSHGAFQTGTRVATVLAALGSMAFQGPVIWWAATHRRHHAHVDSPLDPHSPHFNERGRASNRIAGLWHGHWYWLFKPASTHPAEWAANARDLYKQRHVLTFQMNYVIWPVLGILVPSVAGGVLRGCWLGCLQGGLWGGLVRIFLVDHFYWSVNSFGHLWGRRPFNLPGNNSCNLGLLALPTWGEAWHNNHHAFPKAASLRFRWWQLDPSAAIISGLRRSGLVWQVHQPDRTDLERRLARPAAAGRRRSVRSIRSVRKDLP